MAHTPGLSSCFFRPRAGTANRYSDTSSAPTPGTAAFTPSRPQTRVRHTSDMSVYINAAEPRTAIDPDAEIVYISRACPQSRTLTQGEGDEEKRVY